MPDQTATRSGVTMKGRTLLLAASALLLAACNADKLQVPNNNSPNPSSIDPVSAVNLEIPGILFQARANHLERVRDFTIFGREGFYYFPTDNRWTTGFLVPTGNGLNAASAFGRGSGLWSGGYRQQRNIYTLLKTVEAASDAAITPEQKAGIRGWANTFAGLEMHYILQSRDSLGAVVEMLDDPKAVAPFVSRDEAYEWASDKLDEAAADLDAAGAAFLFASRLTANTGLNGFRTPADFRTFNRAIAARVFAYRGSLGCGVTCYQAALDAIDESFLDVSEAGLSTGLYFVFSTTAGDQDNIMSRASSADRVAHPSIKTVETKVGGAPDDRYATKVVQLVDAEGDPAPRRPAGTDWASIGIETDVGYDVYPTRTTPMPIIRGEELILLRAEARWFTGDKPGAIADIDFIRTTSGGLGASTLTTASTDAQFVTELLAQRRLSLVLEGHRWPDHRRFGRLADLPIDLPATQFIAKVQPIPTEECDYRRDKGAELEAPGCP
jgi:hypothetical protein